MPIEPLAEGTLDGTSWRLELDAGWDPPHLFMATWDGEAAGSNRYYLVGRGGSPRREPQADVLVQLGSSGGTVDAHAYTLGEVARTAAAVTVVLDDNARVDAEICKTAAGDHNVFLAFMPAQRFAVAAQAFLGDGTLLAEDQMAAEAIEDKRWTVGFEDRERRKAIEGVLIGEGHSPLGHPWRLRFWRSPSGEREVDLEEHHGGAQILRDRDIPAHALTKERLVWFSSLAREADEQRASGLAAGSVPRVQLHLADGTTIEADVMKIDADDRAYWIAYAPPDSEIDAALAVNQNGSILAQDSELPELSARIRQARDRQPDSPAR